MVRDTRWRGNASTGTRTRRSVLQSAAAAGVVIGGVTPLAGASGHNDMTEVHVDVDEGDDVADIVENVSSGELLVFPEGEFEWNRHVTVLEDNWGIRGQPDDGTVFWVPEGELSRFGFLSTAVGSSITGDASDNVLLENLTIDSPGRANPGIRFGVRSSGTIDGLHYRCNATIDPDDGMVNGLNLFVQDEAGDLVVKDYKQHNNSRLSDYPGGRVGGWVGGGNVGTVTFINPVITGCPNNALYVSRTPGDVHVVGGYLANNNVSCVRLSGAGTVTNTTMELDIDSYLEGPGETIGGPGGYNTRLVWGDIRGAGRPGGVVNGCTFIARSYEQSQALVANLENPDFTVRNSQFLLDTDVPGVWCHPDNGHITVENCVFDGDAATVASADAVSGTNNCVTDPIEPGPIETVNRNCSFNWEKAHSAARRD